MKKYIYNTLSIAMLLLFFACGNKQNHNVDDGHSHNIEMNKEAEFGHVETDEVVLTPQQFEALNVKIGTIDVRNMGTYIDVNGKLEVPPQSRAAITSVIGANVVSIEVIEGDKVLKGQIVAYLSHPNIVKMQTDYLSALSNCKFLKKTYDRQQKLFNAGISSGANFQKVEAEYEASNTIVNGMAAQLQLLNVDLTTLRSGAIIEKVALESPIEGFVQKVEVKIGQYVEPQTELLDIINTQQTHADFMVFEKDVNKVKIGQEVIFTMQSIQEEEFTAKIYSMSKTFEDNPKAVHVHAEIENKKGDLIPGLYIQGKIQVENTKSFALPVGAIFNEDDKFFVFSVAKENEDWSFKAIEVIIGAKDDNWIEVKFLEEIEPNTNFAYNNAYYLIAEMKKGEAEHEH